MPILVGTQRFARSGEGGGGPAALPADLPQFIGIDDQYALDLNLSGADMWVQFGGVDLPATFDPALALYYPATDAFGIEILPPPVDATQVAVMGVQDGGTYLKQSIAGLESYGGTRQAINWTASDCILECPLNADITALPITIIVRCKPVGAGLNHPFATLLQSTDVASNVPRFQLRINTGNVWNAIYFDAAATSTGVSSALTATFGEWTTAIARWEGTTAPAPTIWKHDRTKGAAIASAAGVRPLIGTYRRLLFGLPHSGGTGRVFYAPGDQVSEVMVLNDTLDDLQMQQFIEDPCPPWNLLVPDPAKIRAWFRCLAREPRREWTLGKNLINTPLLVGDTTTVVAYTGTGAFGLRNHNRLAAMSAASALKVVYADTSSGETDLPANSSCLWRAQAHHKLRIDMASGVPNAASVTAQIFEPATGVGGVGLVYGQGGAVDLDVKNFSGVAADNGSLILNALDYGHGYYPAFQSGLAWTETDTTVTYTHNTPPSGGTYGVRIYKPTGIAVPPTIIFACGSGGNFDDYGTLARYCAARGFCVAILEFEDRSSDTADGVVGPADYHWEDRIAQFEEFLEVHMVIKLGFTPTQIIISGHSGGGFTSLSASGAKWWAWDGSPAADAATRNANWDTGGRTLWTSHTSVVSPIGGGTVVGYLQVSGQGVQIDPVNDLGFRIEAVAWDTCDPSPYYIWWTGTRDAGNNDQAYPWRHEGYGFSPSTLKKMKIGYLNGHHQYGGGLHQDSIAALSLAGGYYSMSPASPDSQKHMEYLKARLFQNQYIAFADMCCGRGSAAHDWLTGNSGAGLWVDEPTLQVAFASLNI